jgi:Lon protease-like protein
MKIPHEVGIMTLPNAILFPQALLPLCIFEPRYREMLQQSLQEQRMFAVALSNGQSQPSRVAGVGLIRACVDKPDGSSNLILQGVTRVRFTNFVQKKPFYIGRIEVLQTLEPEGLEVEALGLKVVETIHQLRAKGHEVPDTILNFLNELKDYDALADIVTYSFLNDVELKQEILETLHLRERLQKVVKALRALLDGPNYNFA